MSEVDRGAPVPLVTLRSKTAPATPSLAERTGSEAVPSADPPAEEGTAARRAPRPLARLPEEWQSTLATWGEPKFRGQQIFRWIHQQGVFDPHAMTNLSLGLRQKLEQAGVGCPLSLMGVQRSSDGTSKLLLRLRDGLVLECVLIPRDRMGLADEEDEPEEDEEDEEELGSAHPSAEPPRPVTLCVSTQVGCAMGCVFCASGQAGLKRGLSADEIVSQVLIARASLEPGQRLRNLVFMGMGEPLHHYAETARAIRLLSHPMGLGMSLRRMTVSTVGLIPGIKKLGEDFEGKIGLAISLHAPDSATRSQIIPMNERFPLPDLLAALRAYPLPKRRRITIEYTLIGGVNDTPAHARKLASTLRNIPIKVNLIPMNPIAASSLRAPSEAGVRAFREVLAELRVSCSVRTTRGDDVDAACGQLALSQPVLPLL